MDAATLEAIGASATASAHLSQAYLDTAAHHMGSSAGHLATVVYSIGEAAAAPDAAIQVSWHPPEHLAAYSCIANHRTAYLAAPNLHHTLQ